MPEATTRIKVSPDDVRRTGATMSADIVTYRQSYEDVYRAADEMKRHWEGRDVTVFHEKLEGYKPVLREMENIIQQYIDYLNRSEAHYRAELNDNVARAAQLP